MLFERWARMRGNGVSGCQGPSEKCPSVLPVGHGNKEDIE